MSIQTQLSERMKDAMRSKDTATLSALRMLKAALLNEEKSGKGEISDADAIRIIRSQIKQRGDSAAAMREGNREEAAAKEEAEAAILQSFLPEPLSDAEMVALVDQAVTATGAESLKQMGGVMAWLKSHSDDRADFSQLSAMVKSRLG
ncbi:GatB/Yqey domain protein [Magnetococcus marinus MC-1]|uniref:GatB/Yqey domain protein n=1 Tax=Magnetococcus marinus (strain ATCC BAA-1437 / JCM 17883 / MC-1) TaxID=156889 RepID=A0L5T3_MAGMM|nr:GatB/YqeY domain-containing protein [Magnetococcus marinus]ABK43326.1 GatB/Yqey domain protein [Magnetococcus marinus MC-1]